jgi:nitroimidazol reductase NimA-like FMN-containing flavoprotein (pyridoxamine 5'-phosphate oxidase superfamily)
MSAKALPHQDASLFIDFALGGLMIGDLTPAEIEELLHRETLARIGCHADGRTYVVPISYAYDGKALLAHSAEGRKIWMMRANCHVCVEIEQLQSPGIWRSVIAWGIYEELAGTEAAITLDNLKARFLAAPVSVTALPPHERSGETTTGERKKAIVFRIRLTEKTGRFEHGAASNAGKSMLK